MKCQSPWNIPLLPVKKPGTHDYHPVQNLGAVNEATVTLLLAVPKPYTLLGLIPSTAERLLASTTCSHLKDAFFCLQLAPVSQPLFAPEWENPHIRNKEQLSWTRPSLSFKNSPILFSGALDTDFVKFPGQELDCVLLK